MRSHGKDVETKQSNHRKGAGRGSNWWMIPVVAMLGLPAPAWSQFKEPVLTEIVSAGKFRDWDPTFSSDMLEVYWMADQARDGIHGWDIWSSRRESIDAPWQDPQPLDVVNTNRAESSPHLSHDGLTLTFASFGREGGYGGLDLWQTHRANRDAPWQVPVNMGATINTRRNEGSASFSPDGLEIIFNDGAAGTGPANPSRPRRSTRGTLADEWTTPELLTPSGSEVQLGSVAYPSLSPDGLALYFSAYGSFGDWDVFVSKRPALDAPFGEKENLGETINSSRRETGPVVAPDGSLYYGYRFSPGTAERLRIWRAEAESILGDFDNNGVLDISDIDDLMVRVARGENPTTYDLNNDAMVNTEDIGVWVKDLTKTWLGDANLDGVFDSADLIAIFTAGEYEDGLAQNSTWSTGDWNGDREFDSGDLIAAFTDGGYDVGPRTAVSAVPEPSSVILLALGMIGLCHRPKRR